MADQDMGKARRGGEGVTVTERRPGYGAQKIAAKIGRRQNTRKQIVGQRI